jgi:DNA mismatch repair ATPase MutS
MLSPPSSQAEPFAVDFMLTTHYTKLCRKFKKKAGQVQLCKMEVRHSNPHDPTDFQFTYKIAPGVSNIQGAAKILRDMKWTTA